MLCRVASERELLALPPTGSNAPVFVSQLFREPDRNNEATALATEPLCAARRGVQARYPCLTPADLLSPLRRSGNDAGSLYVEDFR